MLFCWILKEGLPNVHAFDFLNILLQTQIPHSYGVVECQLDKVLAMRKQLKVENIAVSINDFVIKAVAVALQQVPEMNALFSNDKVGA